MTLSPERKSEITLTNIGLTDCGVIAVQAVSGVSRKEAEKVACDIGGYDARVGIRPSGVASCLRYLGYTILFDYKPNRETVATFVMTHQYGTWLIYIDSHVMALVDGDLHNSKGNWHSPVEEYYKVVAP